MKATMAAAVLLAGSTSWAVPRAAGSEALAAGTRVRVTAAEAFTIPGVGVFQRGRIEGAFETRDSETATARGGDGRTLTVPLPDAQLFGTLASADETTISLLRADGKGPIVIPRAAIGRLHFHRPSTKKATGTGIVLGFLGGLAVGTAYGIVGHPPFEHAYEASVMQEALGYGVLFSIPGAVLGGVMGAGHEGGWREVPVASRVRVGLGSTGRSTGVRVAVSW